MKKMVFLFILVLLSSIAFAEGITIGKELPTTKIGDITKITISTKEIQILPEIKETVFSFKELTPTKTKYSLDFTTGEKTETIFSFPTEKKCLIKEWKTICGNVLYSFEDMKEYKIKLEQTEFGFNLNILDLKPNTKYFIDPIIDANYFGYESTGGIYQENWRAETFYSNFTGKITAIQLDLGSQGNPASFSDLNVAIWSVDAQSKPLEILDNNCITSISDLLPLEHPLHSILDANFSSNCMVNADTNYAIVVNSAGDGDISNRWLWWLEYSTAWDKNGMGSEDSGVSWDLPPEDSGSYGIFDFVEWILVSPSVSSLDINFANKNNGAGIKPDTFTIDGNSWIQNCDTNGKCVIGDLTAFGTNTIHGIIATRAGSDGNFTNLFFGETQSAGLQINFDVATSIFSLVNEENGTDINRSDFNSLKFYIPDSNIIFDFKDNNTNQYDWNNFAGKTGFLEIVYTEGSNYKINKYFDSSILATDFANTDGKIRICVAKYQQFYQQIFVSIASTPIILYNPTADCYSIASNTKYSYSNRYAIDAKTINRPYIVYTIVDGVLAILTNLDGALASSSIDLDAIGFNTTDVEIIVGYDNVAFNPKLNTITGAYDTNTLQIYFQSYHGDYVSTNLKIYEGTTLLYQITQDVNANEFALNWDWSAFPTFTDENILKIVIVGTKADETTTTIIEYFTVFGAEYTTNKDPTFIAIMTILFFLFGITITTLNKTFGWIGIVVCVISMAISMMALPGMFYISMIQGGLFICFLYIILHGGTNPATTKGMR